MRKKLDRMEKMSSSKNGNFFAENCPARRDIDLLLLCSFNRMVQFLELAMLYLGALAVSMRDDAPKTNKK